MARSLYVTVSQAIDNQFIGVLTPCEFAIIKFVNERTLRFQKEWENIPLRHFMEGVYTKAGERIQAGLPFAKSTIIKAYKALIEKGLLQKAAGRASNRFSIHYENLLKLARKMALATRGLKPKRQKAKKNRGVTERTNENVKGVTERTNPYKEQISKTISTRQPDAEAPDISEEETPKKQESISATVDRIIEEGRGRMAAKSKKLSEDLSIANLKAAWQHALIKHDQGRTRVSVGPAEIKRLRGVYRNNTLPIPLDEFIDWAIENWKFLKTHQLKWVRGYPNIPDIGFFTNLFKYFVRAYGEEYEHDEDNREVFRQASAQAAAKRQAPPSPILEPRESRQDAQARRNAYMRRLESLYDVESLSAKRRSPSPRDPKDRYVPDLSGVELAPPIPLNYHESAGDEE